jgi:hypothetical protein
MHRGLGILKTWCVPTRPNSWTKSRQESQEFSSLLFTSHLYLHFYLFKFTQPLTVLTVQLLYRNHTPFAWFKRSIQKPQVWELSRLCPETSKKLYVHEFGFLSLRRNRHLFALSICWCQLLPNRQTLGGFIKDEYCSWVQYKSGPGGGPSMKNSTLNDLVHLTPLRIPLMNPPTVWGGTKKSYTESVPPLRSLLWMAEKGRFYQKSLRLSL